MLLTEPSRKSRLKKTIRNAKVSFAFLVIVLAATFFSRAIFIAKLGAGFVGLVTTIMNIVGFFNLAEMGFASVVAFSLYRPIHDDDRTAIKEIICVFSYIYQRIGLIVLAVGVIGIFMMPFIFRSSGFSPLIVIATYIVYLFTTLLGFFFNCREVLLVADQRSYIKVSIFSSLKLLKLGAQVLAVIFLDDKFIWWLVFEFLSLAVYSKFINISISRFYPWLRADYFSGKQLSGKYEVIYIKAKQAFVHKLASVVLQQTAPIFVFIFLNLQVVTKYTNYTIIISAITSIISALFDSTNAGVGNLVAERNREKTLSVYWELQVSRFWLSGLAAYTTFRTIDIFIVAWVGAAYKLPPLVVLAITVNLFIGVVRKTTDEFISGFGIYHDTGAPLAEAAINIIFTALLGKLYGVLGIAAGAVVSLIVVVGFWKPFFLYREAFGGNSIGYFLKIFKFSLILFVAAAISELVNPLEIAAHPMVNFFAVAAQRFIVFGTVSFAIFFMLSTDMRKFSQRFQRHFFSARFD